MDTNQIMEVRFDLYCRRCKYRSLDEKKDPCNECLEKAYRANSKKPINFEKGVKSNG